jgi:hypothetical protein
MAMAALEALSSAYALPCFEFFTRIGVSKECRTAHLSKCYPRSALRVMAAGSVAEGVCEGSPTWIRTKPRSRRGQDPLARQAAIEPPEQASHYSAATILEFRACQWA